MPDFKVGFDAIVHSTVPTGGGLSSSAALETATAVSIEAITDTKIDPIRRAKLCQQAEHEYAGVPCGLMDQLAVGIEPGLFRVSVGIEHIDDIINDFEQAFRKVL